MDTYFKELAEGFRTATTSNELARQFSDMMSTLINEVRETVQQITPGALPEGEEEDQQNETSPSIYTYIHLKNARVLGSGACYPELSVPGMLWRVKKEFVTGFSLGSPTESK
jgi:hypothetical protein